MLNANGRILWEGPSPIDGAPLVCIATGFEDRSANDKTGGMIQTWIIRADLAPNKAKALGLDYSVCGNCRHRQWSNVGGELVPAQDSCYVLAYQAPRAVWACYHHGAGYAPIGSDWHLFAGLAVRLGSYGDPAMVPAWVWALVLGQAATHTGYSHQWRHEFAQGLRGIVQASCDGMRDYLDATAAGWRTFLVKPAGVPDLAGFVHCAASKERGHKTTCAACTLCDGASADVVIDAHGSKAGRVLVGVSDV